MNKKLLVLFFVLIFILPIVYAPKPSVSSATVTLDGYYIEQPLLDFIKANSTYKWHFHVVNLSNGLPVTDKTLPATSCMFHLYNQSGAHIQVQQASFEKVYDWEVLSNPNNFSTYGVYHYIFQCNNTIRGGLVSAEIEVNPTGFEATIGKSIIYLILLFTSIVLTLGVFFYALTLDGNNTTNFMGITTINYKKYVKFGLFGLTFMLYLWVIFVCWKVAEQFLYLGNMIIMFRTLFYLSAWIATPLVWIILLAYMLHHLIKDNELIKMGNRGLRPR